MKNASTKSFWAMLSVFFVCATIAWLAYLAWHAAAQPATGTRRLWTPIVILTNGIQTVQLDTRRLEFWTPSAKTKDYLARDGGAIRDRDKWEVIASDDAVVQFGNLLHADPNVAGYRRTEVWGHGRTVMKPGWWWTMTVATNYTVDRFVGAYRGFWKSPNTVFVEVIDNRGRDAEGD